ncbi:hypothetical protein K8R42_00515 [bacterium]|nr:hypothetical protein [bacterium]
MISKKLFIRLLLVDAFLVVLTIIAFSKVDVGYEDIITGLIWLCIFFIFTTITVAIRKPEKPQISTGELNNKEYKFKDALKKMFSIMLYALIVISMVFISHIPFPEFYRPYVGSQPEVLVFVIVIFFVFLCFLLLYKKYYQTKAINILFWLFFILANVSYWSLSVYLNWYLSSQESFGNLILFPFLILLAIANVLVLKFIVISIGNIFYKKPILQMLTKTAIGIIIVSIIIGGWIIIYKQNDKSKMPWRYEVTYQVSK